MNSLAVLSIFLLNFIFKKKIKYLFFDMKDKVMVVVIMV